MAFVYWCLAAVKKVVLLDERRLPSLPCLQWTLTCPSLLDCTMVLPLTSGCQCPASLKFTSRILPSHPLCQRGSASVQTHLCLSLLLSPLLFFWPSCCCGPLDCSLCTDLSNAWLFQSHRLGFFFLTYWLLKVLSSKVFSEQCSLQSLWSAFQHHHPIQQVAVTASKCQQHYWQLLSTSFNG